MFARAAIKFDLSSIPNNVRITNAELSIFFLLGDPGLGVCSLYAIEKDWDVSVVTWTNAKSDVLWETWGGDYNNDEFVLADCAESSQNWEIYDVTSDIKEFYQYPENNFGFFIYPASDDGPNSVPGRTYASSEASLDSIRPKLIIKYDDSDEIITNGLQNVLSNNIEIIKESDNIKFYLPFTGTYSVSITNVKGINIVSFKGNSERWYQIHSKRFKTGLHVLYVEVNGRIYSKKFLLIK